MHAKKSGLVLLLGILWSCAPANASRTRWDIAPVFKVQLPPMPVLVKPVLSLPSEPPLRVPHWFTCGCAGGRGFGAWVPGVVEPRASQLHDPVAALGAAYLQSRSVKAALLDPELPVADYREGLFGRWVQHGLLVKEHIEFTREPELQRVFALLSEAISDGGEDFYGSLAAQEPHLSLDDFRQRSGFLPEMTFEFIGGVVLRIELSRTRSSLLMQRGERWDVYGVNRWTADALEQLLVDTATRSGR